MLSHNTMNINNNNYYVFKHIIIIIIMFCDSINGSVYVNHQGLAYVGHIE